MSGRMRSKHWLTLAGILCIMFLPACGSATPTKQVQQELDAATRETIQQELVAIMLDTLQQETSSRTKPSIIVWRTASLFSDDTGYKDVTMGDLIKGWWCEDGQLVEMSDPDSAIAQYHRDYMVGQDLNATWGEYEFGILSISDDGRHAEIGLSASNAMDAARAVIYTLDRNMEGEWEITGEEWLWVA